MSSALRAYSTACGLLLVVAVAGSSCRRAAAPTPIDLLREFPGAERRAVRPVNEAVRLDTVTLGGSTRLALITMAPARVTWLVRLTAQHAVLHAAVALLPAPGDTDTTAGVLVRVGISNNRFFEDVIRVPLKPAAPGADAAWQPLDVDLSAYSGWRFSLFNQPYRTTWKLILNAEAHPRGTVAWADLRIDLK